MSYIHLKWRRRRRRRREEEKKKKKEFLYMEKRRHWRTVDESRISRRRRKRDVDGSRGREIEGEK